MPQKRQVRELYSRMPLPPWNPKADSIEQAYFSRLAEMDLGFRLNIRELNRRLPLFVLLRIKGCSGFRMTTNGDEPKLKEQ